MAEDLLRLERFVAGLVRRERLVVVLWALVRLGLGFAVLFCVLSLLAAWRIDRSVAAFVGASALALVLALASWGLRTRWLAAGDGLRQARLVERLRPALGGRLVTAVDYMRQGKDSAGVRAASPAMLGLVAKRAAAAVADVTGGLVHPALRAVAGLLAVPVALLVALVVALLTPGGLSGVLGYWAGQSAAEGMLAALGAEAGPDAERVGDLVLRYTYPEYTGLEPREVSRSTGDVRGPPGTVVEVSARTEDAVEAAGLIAYEERLEARVRDGRTVEGRFDIGAEPGLWQLVTWRGGEQGMSNAFEIIPEPDGAPAVLLDVGGDTLEVALDDTISGTWSARDDFGMQAVWLRVGAQDMRPALAEPTVRNADLSGQLNVTPMSLGLRAGQEVELRVVARDNDSFSGPKEGLSNVVRLRVLGAQQLDQRDLSRAQDAVDAMLVVLADFLEEPMPQGPTGGTIAVWGAQVAQRYTPLEVLWKQIDGDAGGSNLLVVQLGNVLDKGGALTRYTQTAFSPSQRDAPSAPDLRRTDALRTEALLSLEDGILALDTWLMNNERAAALREASALTRVATELQAALAQEKLDPRELQARLDQFSRTLAQLESRVSKLEETGLRDFLQDRTAEMRALTDETREAISRQDEAESKLLMQRLADQASQLERAIREAIETAKKEGESAESQGKQLVEELKRIEADQRARQAETEAALESLGEGQREELSALWRELQAHGARLSAQGSAYREGLVASERMYVEVGRAEELAIHAKRIHEAAIARDVRGIERGLEEGDYAMRLVRHALMEISRTRGPLVGPGHRELDAMDAELTAIRELLAKLNRAASKVDPTTREKLGEGAEAQRQLSEDLKQAQAKAEELSRELPVRPTGMREAMVEGGERMAESGRDLGVGNAQQAAGSQGAAAERVREAREALERALQQAAQQRQTQGEPGDGEGQGEGEGEGEEDGEKKGEGGEQMGRQPTPTRMDLLGSEDGMSEDAFRKALLEGMQGEVPEAYRALKKRYYEELVNR